MSPQLTGLGKGLSSLIPKKPISEAIREEHRPILFSDNAHQLLSIPPDLIDVNPYQPRTVFEHEELENLIESIRKHGIMQPLVVTRSGSRYQLIAGERRLRAAKIIGLATVPAIVREAGEQEKLELALIENIQRRNLNPLEKAVAYQKLMHEFNLTQEEVADKLGMSRSSVANTVRYLDLPDEVQKAMIEGKITEGHAKLIAGLEDRIEQLDFLKKILQNSYTVRQAESVRPATPKAKAKTKARALRDPYLEEKESDLRDKLGTKVAIHKQGDKGQIVVEFYSEEELEAVIRRILN